MINKIIDYLFLTILCIHLGMMMYFGVYGADIFTIAEYIAALIFIPFLTSHLIVLVKTTTFEYLERPERFTRSLILQRIDPLLN